MAALDRTQMITAEGVPFDLRLAGLGSRFSAGLVDLVVWIVAISLISSQTDGAIDGGVGTAVAVVLSFVLFLGYHVFFDVVWKGRSPGKRMHGLRVVTEHGGPVDARRSAIRNFMRFADMLPTAFVVGMISIATSTRAQRLGDLAAGTVVIVEPSRTRKRRLVRRSRNVANEPARSLTEQVPLNELQVAELMTWDVSQISREEVGLVLQYLARRPSLSGESNQHLATTIAARLRPRVAGVPPQLTDERFLELVGRAKQLRR